MKHDGLVGSPGQEVGFVNLVEKKGEPGEQGEVWLARARVPASDNTNAPEFAVKLSKKPIDGKNDPNYTTFMNEFDVASRLTDPAAVRVYSSGLVQISRKLYPYYVMEYLGEGVSPLGKVIDTLDQHEQCALALRALFQVAGPLRELHSISPAVSAHGDIKPANILVHLRKDELPVIKLIDFGFSCILPPEDSEAVVKARAGRAPGKASSIPRPTQASTPQHADIWQLCFMTMRLLEELPQACGNKQCQDCPIDGKADLPELKRLLQEWGGASKASKAESDLDVSAFYEALDTLTERTNLSSLTPDVKGSVRLLSLEELATAARIQPAFEMMRIPPTHMVAYPERIKELITTPSFGVLRFVRQLGFCHLVYPGALGTRFEHSIGVYDLACRFILRMSGHAEFRRHCANPSLLHAFLVAALLHDVGHFPYAHQLEEFSRSDFTPIAWAKMSGLVKGHVYWGAHKLDTLRPMLKSAASYTEQAGFALSDESVDLIKQWMTCPDTITKHTSSPGICLFNYLLDGPIDLDKLDYIERDAHHCGVPYGNELDIDRLLDTVRMYQDSDGGLRIAFHKRALGAIEQLASARHQMYAHVYWHRAVRSATVMFKHAVYLLQELMSKDEIETAFFKASSDDSLMDSLLQTTGKIRRDTANPSDERQTAMAAIEQLLQSVSGRNRNLYKAVVDLLGDDEARSLLGHDYTTQRSVARHIWKGLCEQGYIDAGVADAGEHNVLIDSRVDKEVDYSKVIIVDDAGNPQKLTELSPSTGQLAHDFKIQACRARVFINAGTLRKEYRAKAARAQLRDTVRTLAKNHQN